uniref:40S ribosomal protein S6 n=1 Tax=Angiostrongylus cantonensis TaxID=6313 RepID=A0A0K0DEJ0_ANGCA
MATCFNENEHEREKPILDTNKQGVQKALFLAVRKQESKKKKAKAAKEEKKPAVAAASATPPRGRSRVWWSKLKTFSTFYSLPIPEIH